MTIVWDAQKMSTGVPVLDSEHKEWIRRFNEFESSIISGNGPDAVGEILDFMAEYSETHFVHEEMLAGDLDTPAVKINHIEHNNFRVKIREMRNWIKYNGASSFEVLSLQIDLEEWLVHHICAVDAQIWLSERFREERRLKQIAAA